MAAFFALFRRDLELALRHWDVGQHGVWGGLVAADRAYLARAGTHGAG